MFLQFTHYRINFITIDRCVGNKSIGGFLGGLFFILTVLGLHCGTRALRCGTRASLVVACRLSSSGVQT